MRCFVLLLFLAFSVTAYTSTLTVADTLSSTNKRAQHILKGTFSWTEKFDNTAVTILVSDSDIMIYEQDDTLICYGDYYDGASKNSLSKLGRVNLWCPEKGLVTLLVLYHGNDRDVDAIGLDSRDYEVSFTGRMLPLKG